MNSKWLIGYKDNTWKTIELPGLLKDSAVEAMLGELNQYFDIVYVRIVNGISEKDNHKTKKGEFLGL
jgi:hypothetical protein